MKSYAAESTYISWFDGNTIVLNDIGKMIDYLYNLFTGSPDDLQIKRPLPS